LEPPSIRRHDSKMEEGKKLKNKRRKRGFGEKTGVWGKRVGRDASRNLYRVVGMASQKGGRAVIVHWREGTCTKERERGKNEIL